MWGAAWEARRVARNVSRRGSRTGGGGDSSAPVKILKVRWFCLAAMVEVGCGQLLGGLVVCLRPRLAAREVVVGVTNED